MSVKEELFVASVVAGKGPQDAAIDAGYSPRSAKVTAQKILKRPQVAAAIEAAKTRITRKYRVTAERVIEEMATVSFSDIRHYTIDGRTVDWLALAPGAPESALRAVKKVKRVTREIPRGKDLEPIIETQTELEFWSKDQQLGNLGDYLKLFKENRQDGDDRDQHSLTPDQRKTRVLNLLKVAAKRRREALGDKKAG